MEPSIFGTLFERILNPAKRSQLGAHYTSRADTETLLSPVLLEPLRREWRAIRERADAALEKGAKLKSGKAKAAALEFEKAVGGSLGRLAGATVLDPACGRGNFLYVALHLLMDSEKEVLTYAAAKTGQTRFPGVRPTQPRGIEVNPYARGLAQVVLWIGYIQWVKFNGFQPPRDPVLDLSDSQKRSSPCGGVRFFDPNFGEAYFEDAGDCWIFLQQLTDTVYEEALGGVASSSSGMH